MTPLPLQFRIITLVWAVYAAVICLLALHSDVSTQDVLLTICLSVCVLVITRLVLRAAPIEPPQSESENEHAPQSSTNGRHSGSDPLPRRQN